MDRNRHVDGGNGGGEGERGRMVASRGDDITIFAAVTTYLGYVVLIATGHIRDVCASVFGKGRYLRSGRGIMMMGTSKITTTASTKTSSSPPPPRRHRNHRHRNIAPPPPSDPTKYAPLLKSWENFYTRRLYHRIQDCFNRPIASRPCATISVLERVSHDGNKTMSVLGPLSNLVSSSGGGEAHRYP